MLDVKGSHMRQHLSGIMIFFILFGPYNYSLQVTEAQPSITPRSMMPVSPTDSQATILAKAANVIPSPQQLAWQHLELTSFIHFGMNTFTDSEWGSGTEDPSIFNPTQLDARQWMRALKSAGIKQAILVVKHHDGFTLYPSRYTTHSVKYSPWKGGHGDVVRDFVNAAHEFGIKVGFYLSPADRHEALPGGSFGHGSPSVTTKIPTLVPGDNRHPTHFYTYQLDDYNRYFMNQLYELMTQYGPVYELWFDGATAAGTSEPYNFAAWYDLIHHLAPNAVIGLGNVRWVGNENGYARDSEWSVIPLAHDYNIQPSGDLTGTDLGSRARLFAPGVNYLAWYPAEVNFSIRPGWFWHASQDNQVKTMSDLMDRYYHSVGLNGVMLLNVPPDRRGLFGDNDVQRLQQFGQWIKQTFQHNLAQGAKAVASSVFNNNSKFAAGKAVDDNPNTYWKAADGSTAELTLDMGHTVQFNRVMLGESLAIGQRVEAFEVDSWTGSAWQKITTATTIGYKRILTFDTVRTQKVRLLIQQARVAPTIATFGLYMDNGMPSS
jgi:alpha-L-fucosidase